MNNPVGTKQPDAAQSKKILTLRRFNDVLTVVVIVFGLYLVLKPVFPMISFWVKQRTAKDGGYVYQTNLQKPAPQNADQPPTGKPIPADNRLVLPAIFLDEPIHDGPNALTLKKGLWRLPKSSTPDKGGNTVVVGHRFTYDGPAVFYQLDKLKVGQKFPLYWQGKEYDYEITEIKTVSPFAVDVEAPTADERVTIYTCTPLLTAKNRLVIVAKRLGDI